MKLRSALLYLSLALGATQAGAGDATSVLEAAKAEGLKALAVHSAPKPLPEAAFEGPDGAASLADHRGQVVVLNFWAVWCAPCREEMPTLSALQEEYGGEDFAVVTVATGPNAPPAVTKFLTEVGADNLPLYRDPRSALARGAGVLGLPVTVILNREGQEIARLVGPADWFSDAAQGMVEGLLAADG